MTSNNISFSKISDCNVCVFVCACVYVYNIHSRCSVLMSASYAKNKILGQNQS